MLEKNSEHIIRYFNRLKKYLKYYINIILLYIFIFINININIYKSIIFIYIYIYIYLYFDYTIINLLYKIKNYL